MKSKLIVAASTLAILLTSSYAQGATINADLTFTAESSLFGGAAPTDFQIGPDSFGVRGLAEVRYEATASAGSVDARVDVRLEATHPDVLTFAEAAAVPVDLNFGDISVPIPLLPDFVFPGAVGSFETRFGLEADVDVIVLGAANLHLLNIDGLLETSAGSFLPFSKTIEADDEVVIESAGNIWKDPLLGTKWGAKANVFATQESELDFGPLTGNVRATHEDGSIVTGTFSMEETAQVLLDLQRVGDWTLDLASITVEGDFSSDFGMLISGKACVAFCGSIRSGVLPIGSSSFDLHFTENAVQLATLTVQDIPLPAGLPLLAGGLGTLALMGWRRRWAT